MLVVQPCGLDGADEELASVGVGSGVGLGKNSWSGVLELEVLILEFVSVDGLSSSSVVVGEVTSLAHEIVDDTVERGSLVSESLLSCAQGSEVLSGPWDNISTELQMELFFRIVANIIENLTDVT